MLISEGVYNKTLQKIVELERSGMTETQKRLQTEKVIAAMLQPDDSKCGIDIVQSW